MSLPRRNFLLLALLIFSVGFAGAQDSSGWHSIDLPYRVLNVTSVGNALWICGTDETIAMSPDNGAHWQIRHQAPNGRPLLDIEFANDKFGYAIGTGGLVLMTEDGGQTWAAHSVGTDTILQSSFSDPQHGIARTLSSLMFTADGGAHWTAVVPTNNADEMKRLRYSIALAAIDPLHMSVMLKEGPAQYYAQALLVTQDGGKSWTFQDIPDSIIASLVALGGKYWAVGHVVVDKDKPGGGHSVAAAFWSADGIKWNRQSNDISKCQPELCTVCKSVGCLASNGILGRILGDTVVFQEFTFNKALTTKWTATGSEICFVGNGLECTSLRDLSKSPNYAGGTPTVLAPPPLGTTPPPQGIHCISCAMSSVFLDNKVKGVFTLKLTLLIASNGTVETVDVADAPTDEIKSKIQQEAEQWVFEPLLKDGKPVAVKLNTSVKVNVIKPK